MLCRRESVCQPQNCFILTARVACALTVTRLASCAACATAYACQRNAPVHVQMAREAALAAGEEPPVYGDEEADSEDDEEEVRRKRG